MARLQSLVDDVTALVARGTIFAAVPGGAAASSPARTKAARAAAPRPRPHSRSGRRSSSWAGAGVVGRSGPDVLEPVESDGVPPTSSEDGEGEGEAVPAAAADAAFWGGGGGDTPAPAHHAPSTAPAVDPAAYAGLKSATGAAFAEVM